MAVPTGSVRTTQFETNAQVRYVEPLLEYASPDDIPLTKLFGISEEECDNPKLEWVEDELNAVVVKNGYDEDVNDGGTDEGNISGSASNTKLLVKKSDVHHFQKGSVIQIGTTDEYLLVTDVATTDTTISGTDYRALTVSRGYAGTSASTAHTADADIRIITVVAEEGKDSPAKGMTELALPYNYFQIFDKSYTISHRQKNTRLYGIKNDPAYQLEKALTESAIQLENALFRGYRQAATADTPAMLGGLGFFLNSSKNTAFPSTNEKNLNGSAYISTKVINDTLQELFYNVGPSKMGKTLICGAAVKRQIADLFYPNAQMPMATRKGGVVVNTLQTDFGTIDVLMHIWCPPDTIYIVNPKFCKIHPYKNSRFFDQFLAKSGAYDKRQIYGDYSFECRNVKAQGRIYGIKTS